MKTQSSVTERPAEAPTEASGWWWAALGVLCFSLTLPATRLAVPEFGAFPFSFGRDAVAGFLAAALLLIRRDRLPERRYWVGLGWVSLGVVFGFPLFTSLALRTVPASHGAVITGLLPAATAIAAVVFARERPKPAFWAVCALGVLAVLGFAATTGAGLLEPGDVYLLLAVSLAATGYAEGGRLAKELGGWRVISWALVFSLPVAVVALLLLPHPPQWPSAGAWLSFGYVSVISMFLAFFAWYKGLALGGVARADQVQLVQPVLTLLWSVLLLGEALDLKTAVAAAAVVGCALLSRLTR